MIWLWLSSRTRRQGWQLLGQGQRLFHEQTDLLSDEAQSEFTEVLAEFRQVLCSPGSQLTISLAADRFEAAANRLLIPFPSDSLREGFREVLMAVVTILAFTTFFLQLTPTGVPRLRAYCAQRPVRVPTGKMRTSASVLLRLSDEPNS